MSNDFDIESLSKTWQSQEVANKFEQAKFKRQLLLKRVTLMVVSMIEVFILLATAGLLFVAFVESWAIHIKMGLTFALSAGGITFAVIVKSRIKSYQMITSSTTEWLDFEKRMSEESLRRGAYTNYLIAIFSAAFVVALVYELMFLESDLTVLAFRFGFGCIWLLSAFFINRYLMKKHIYFLSSLK